MPTPLPPPGALKEISELIVEIADATQRGDFNEAGTLFSALFPNPMAPYVAVQMLSTVTAMMGGAHEVLDPIVENMVRNAEMMQEVISDIDSLPGDSINAFKDAP